MSDSTETQSRQSVSRDMKAFNERQLGINAQVENALSRGEKSLKTVKAARGSTSVSRDIKVSEVFPQDSAPGIPDAVNADDQKPQPSAGGGPSTSGLFKNLYEAAQSGNERLIEKLENMQLNNGQLGEQVVKALTQVANLEKQLEAGNETLRRLYDEVIDPTFGKGEKGEGLNTDQCVALVEAIEREDSESVLNILNAQIEELNADLAKAFETIGADDEPGTLRGDLKAQLEKVKNLEEEIGSDITEGSLKHRLAEAKAALEAQQLAAINAFSLIFGTPEVCEFVDEASSLDEQLVGYAKAAEALDTWLQDNAFKPEHTNSDGSGDRFPAAQWLTGSFGMPKYKLDPSKEHKMVKKVLTPAGGGIGLIPTELDMDRVNGWWKVLLGLLLVAVITLTTVGYARNWGDHVVNPNIEAAVEGNSASNAAQCVEPVSIEMRGEEGSKKPYLVVKIVNPKFYTFATPPAFKADYTQSTLGEFKLTSSSVDGNTIKFDWTGPSERPGKPKVEYIPYVDSK